MTNNQTEMDELTQWNQEISKSFTLSIAVHVILFIFGTFGNSVIIIFYNFRLQGNKDDRYFIPILAVIDLLATIFATWFDLTVNVVPVMFPDDILCKCLLYFNFLTTQGSMFLLLLISIHRFRKICHPFQKQMSLYWKRASLIIIAGVTIVMLVPELIFYGKVPVRNEEKNITGYICGPITDPPFMQVGLFSFTAFAMSVAVISILIMCILYGQILRHLLRQTRGRKQSKRSLRVSEASDPCDASAREGNIVAADGNEDQSPCSPQLNHENEINGNEDKDNGKMPSDAPNRLKRSSGSRIRLSSRRLTFMFMTISLTNIISNIPTIIYVILCVNDPEAWFRDTYGFLQQLYQFMRAMRVINHAVNPFLYGLFDGKFRDEIKRLFHKAQKVDL